MHDIAPGNVDVLEVETRNRDRHWTGACVHRKLKEEINRVISIQISKFEFAKVLGWGGATESGNIMRGEPELYFAPAFRMQIKSIDDQSPSVVIIRGVDIPIVTFSYRVVGNSKGQG